MVAIPYRTGLFTINALLRKVCQLIVKFRPLWLTFMTTEQVAQMDLLMEVCEEVTAMITALLASDTT